MAKQLTIVYHLHVAYDESKKSVKSILSQSDKNFDIICILDNIDSAIKKIIEDKEITSLMSKTKNVTFIVVDKTLGHSWCFNKAMELVKTPYLYYASGGCVFHTDFVKEVSKKLEAKKPDLLIFNYDEQTHKHFLELTEKTDSYHFYQTFLNSYTNKIFKCEFLKKHNIQFVEFKHYTHLFIYKVLSNFPYIEQLQKILVDVHYAKHPGYNTYDVLTQFQKIYKDGKKTEFYKQFKDSIEYMVIRTTLFTFLYYMYVNLYETNRKAFKISVDNAITALEKHIPNWRKNKYLLAEDTMDNKFIWEYLKHFDDNPKKIARSLEEAVKQHAW